MAPEHYERASPYGQPMEEPPRRGGGLAMKEGDWLCPSCGNHNFASRTNCNKCHEVREGMKEGDWICRSCKNHNFGRRQECNKCQMPRHDQPMSHGGKMGMMPMKGGMMQMQHMQHMHHMQPVYPGKGMMMMPKGKGKGMMMMQPMPMQMYQPMMKGKHEVPHGHMGKGASNKPMKDGDWICQDCGNHNFAARVNCNKCDSLRVGFRQGDWICKDRDCRNHNFASRGDCNKCHKPKE